MLNESEAIQVPVAHTEPTMVFIHGSGDSARNWAGVMELLLGYACWPLDLPGHGAQIERPGPDAMSVADYADAVRAMLVERGGHAAPGVCLVGHSLGSAIALRLAVEHPALVSRLVLVGAGARLRVLPALLEEARTQPGEAKHKLTMLGFAPGHEQEAQHYIDALPPVAPGILHRDLSACDSFDMMADLGRVAQPTLIVVGEADRLTPPKYATFLHDRIAGAELLTIANAGHHVAVEAPAALATGLRDWLSRHR